jgi:predicted RNase H-like nuclease (RuvC/YqgF family)
MAQEDRPIENTIKALQKKIDDSIVNINRDSANIEVITTICSNMFQHLSTAVTGAETRDNFEDKYRTLLANVKVIQDAMSNEPGKLRAQIQRQELRVEVYNETIQELNAEIEKYAKAMALHERSQSGEFDKPRKPGQRPESLKAIRDARPSRDEPLNQTLSGLGSYATQGSD